MLLKMCQLHMLVNFDLFHIQEEWMIYKEIYIIYYLNVEHAIRYVSV